MAEHNQDKLVSADLAEIVSGLIRARKKRGLVFSPGLFSDPAWEILLVLFLAELRQHRTALMQVARLTSTPLTTTLRWIDTLEREGWVVRRPDPLDGRRVHVELSERGSTAMHGWIDDWIESQARQADDIRGVLSRLGGLQIK